jgi:hypothetical protein
LKDLLPLVSLSVFIVDDEEDDYDIDNAGDYDWYDDDYDDE